MRTHPILLAAVLAVGACADKAPVVEETPPPTMTEVFPNLPVPPMGQMVSREGAGNALQLVFATPTSADSVADYYRDVLARPPYELINEATTNGIISFFVEQDGPSMWVAVQGLEAGGSLVTVAGARPRILGGDSVRVLPTRPPEPGELPLQ